MIEIFHLAFENKQFLAGILRMLFTQRDWVDILVLTSDDQIYGIFKIN